MSTHLVLNLACFLFLLLNLHVGRACWQQNSPRERRSSEGSWSPIERRKEESVNDKIQLPARAKRHGLFFGKQVFVRQSPRRRLGLHAPAPNPASPNPKIRGREISNVGEYRWHTRRPNAEPLRQRRAVLIHRRRRNQRASAGSVVIAAQRERGKLPVELPPFTPVPTTKW